MLTVALLTVSHVAVLAAGILFGPKIEAWVATWSAAKAVSDAKKLIAKAESDAAALDKAKKLVASQPSPTGTTGAKHTGPTGA